MHPHLNHLGADVCRGLMLFDSAVPLGDDGLGWLEVQARARARACGVFVR